MYSPEIIAAKTERISEIENDIVVISGYVEDLGFWMLHGFVEESANNVNCGTALAFMMEALAAKRSTIQTIRRIYNIPETQR